MPPVSKPISPHISIPEVAGDEELAALDEKGDVCMEGDVAIEAEVDEDDVAGKRIAPIPYKPSRQEVEEHSIDHLPFRNWCPHCVVGPCHR